MYTTTVQTEMQFSLAMPNRTAMNPTVNIINWSVRHKSTDALCPHAQNTHHTQQGELVIG
jgi:hypothetical protein